MRIPKSILAIVLGAYLLLITVLWAVMHDLPDPNNRNVTVAPTEGGCILVLHRFKHEIRPASECRNIGKALIQAAGP